MFAPNIHNDTEVNQVQYCVHYPKLDLIRNNNQIEYVITDDDSSVLFLICSDRLWNRLYYLLHIRSHMFVLIITEQ